MDVKQGYSIDPLRFESQMIMTACAHCGVLFGITAGHAFMLEKSGKTFCCPNGHKMHLRDSPEEKCRALEKKVSDQEKAMRETQTALMRLTHENDQLTAANRAKARRPHRKVSVGAQSERRAGVASPDATPNAGQ